MPSKIAIVGAPGSGKSRLATGLDPHLAGRTKVIDNYIDEIGKESDLAVGVEASYIGNLFFITGRYGRERKAWNCGCFENVITCGTFVESSVYATMNSMALAREPGHEATNWTRITNFMNLLGSFYIDTLGTEGYDHVFLAPLDNPQLDTMEGQVNQNLLMALAAFNLEHEVLKGTDDEKVKQMLTAIQEEPDESTPTE